jgi:hypothetical protein
MLTARKGQEIDSARVVFELVPQFHQAFVTRLAIMDTIRGDILVKMVTSLLNCLKGTKFPSMAMAYKLKKEVIPSHSLATK